MSSLSAEQLEALRHIDSPILSNAIEQFNVRSLVEGYAGWDLRCAFPEIGTTIGYAVTCTGDSTTASRTGDRGLMRLWEAVEAAAKPAVIVIKDIGSDRRSSCHMGEVMEKKEKEWGVVG